MKKSPAVGILGGTFNPIHFGHLRMAEELSEILNFDEVRFIPSANPPHKPAPAVGAEHRAAMVKLAIASNSTFKFDGRELDRTGASYTFDTLSSLREELGAHASITLLMGNDAFTKLNTWHRWEELLNLSHICLVARPHPTSKKNEGLSKILESYLQAHYTENSADLLEQPYGCITMQKITSLDISSTAIRHALHNKRSARYLLPDTLLEYIHLHQLY